MIPMIRPSSTNGERTTKSFAPIYFIIAISSLRTVIPMVTVLLIRKIETPNRIKMIAIDTYPTSTLTLESVFATTSDLLTFLTPSSPSANFTSSFCVAESDLLLEIILLSLSSCGFI